MFDCIEYNEALKAACWCVGYDDFCLFWELAVSDDYSGFVFKRLDEKPLHRAYIGNPL